MTCVSWSRSSRSWRHARAPAWPTVPRQRSAKSLARSSKSSQSRRAWSASGSRSLRSHRIPVALRDELTATTRERISPFGALPYCAGVSRRLNWIVLGVALVAGIGIGTAIAATRPSSTVATPVSETPGMKNPNLDPGTRLSGAAPGFSLIDQFGKRVSLSSMHGKVVVLAFNDPECTTICPLTTTAMLHAKALLGPAGSGVELVGIGANPEATEVKWVRAYSKAHGMLHKWGVLTGALP